MRKILKNCLVILCIWAIPIILIKITYNIPEKSNINWLNLKNIDQSIIAACIAVTGVYFTIKMNYENKRKELLDNLDSKSEWRKQLYDLASKTFLTTDDVYRVLASLRYLPKEEKKVNNFDKITRVIFGEMYEIIEIKHSKGDYNLNFDESEIVKLFTKYLLKHHWEYNGEDKEKYIKKEDIQFYEVYKCVQDIKNSCYSMEYIRKMKEMKDDEITKSFMEKAKKKSEESKKSVKEKVKEKVKKVIEKFKEK